MLKPDTAIIFGFLIEEASSRLDDQEIKEIAAKELENGELVFEEASYFYKRFFIPTSSELRQALRREVLSLHLTLNQIKNAHGNGSMSKIAHMHQIIAETEKSTNELNRLLNLAFYEGEDDQTYASFMNIFSNKS
ncbi:hypothetical protein [Priestia megaterium]|uniref:hypothetical protein n=1 Tax=Priestia megaterium TaxID=1404 RepID=UPI0020A029E7|nr:hypothetical protein [Priestia megaterium]MCP1451410.1 hypothetical protein [Priestia megaterium]